MNKYLQMLTVASLTIPASAGVIFDTDFTSGGDYAENATFDNTANSDGWRQAADTGATSILGAGGDGVKVDWAAPWGGFGNANGVPAADSGLTTTAVIEFKINLQDPGAGIGASLPNVNGDPFMTFGLSSTAPSRNTATNLDGPNAIGFGLGWNTWGDNFKVYADGADTGGAQIVNFYDGGIGYNPDGRNPGTGNYGGDNANQVARDLTSDDLRLTWTTLETETAGVFDSAVFLYNITTDTLLGSTSFTSTNKSGIATSELFFGMGVATGNGAGVFDRFTISSIALSTAAPEPSSLALIGMGAVLLSRTRRRKMQQS